MSFIHALVLSSWKDVPYTHIKVVQTVNCIKHRFSIVGYPFYCAKQLSSIKSFWLLCTACSLRLAVLQCACLCWYICGILLLFSELSHLNGGRE